MGCIVRVGGQDINVALVVNGKTTVQTTVTVPVVLVNRGDQDVSVSVPDDRVRRGLIVAVEAMLLSLLDDSDVDEADRPRHRLVSDADEASSAT
jgi:hypothetical protein